MISRRDMFVALLVVAVLSVVAGGMYRTRNLEARQQSVLAPTATIKDLMDAIVDPSADVVWGAVATTVGQDGVHEKVPQTEQDWVDARRGAIRLVEGANLLLMPGRHVARPGEKSATPGVELEPTEMEALVNKDRPAWESRARAFHKVSLEALSAIDARDANRLLEVGADVDAACENCHRQYWYPNEKIPTFPSDAGLSVQIGQ